MKKTTKFIFSACFATLMLFAGCSSSTNSGNNSDDDKTAEVEKEKEKEKEAEKKKAEEKEKTCNNFTEMISGVTYREYHLWYTSGFEYDDDYTWTDESGCNNHAFLLKDGYKVSCNDSKIVITKGENYSKSIDISPSNIESIEYKHKFQADPYYTYIVKFNNEDFDAEFYETDPLQVHLPCMGENYDIIDAICVSGKKGNNSGSGESGSIDASDFEGITWKYAHENVSSTSTQNVVFENGTITVKTISTSNNSGTSHQNREETASYELDGDKITITYESGSYDVTAEYTISVDGNSLTLEGKDNDANAISVLGTLFQNTSGTASITFTKD